MDENGKQKTENGMTIVDGKEIIRLIAEKYGVDTDKVYLYYSRKRTDGIFALVREEEKWN